MKDEAVIHWAPGALEWLANAKRRRELTKQHEERAIKSVLRWAKWEAPRKAK